MTEQETSAATRWTCEGCGRQGVIYYPASAGVYEVLFALEDDHAAASPECRFDVGRVRVEDAGVRP